MNDRKTRNSNSNMKIERIRVQNFRCLYDVELEDIPRLAVFVGKNGSGKSTLFQVFAFLKDALTNNVSIALQRMGGYEEVVTRGHANKPIVIEIGYRMPIAKVERLVTYRLEISIDKKGQPVIKREILRYTRGEGGYPFHFLDFTNGKGYATRNEEDTGKPDEELERDEQTLDSRDILAIKGLGQFQTFKAASAFRTLIENWHISDFHIADARQQKDVGVDQHLSASGDNLSVVAQNLYKHDRKTFDKILKEFIDLIPGMSDVTPRVAEDGRVLLRFQDGAFTDPFMARYVSDGTIKMFAYLVLLHDPRPHPFLCIEEPENQLYPELLVSLLGKLRAYAVQGGQVFVSTHSPDMLNYAEIEEAFFLEKQKGLTKISPLASNEQIKALVSGGDQLGWLWRQNLLDISF